jgi:hypothetical protein
MDATIEYSARLTAWQEKLAVSERRHRWLGNLRVLFAIVVLGLGGYLCRSQAHVGFVFVVILCGLSLSGMVHARVLRAKDFAKRAIQYYRHGLDRLQNRWAGKGIAGNEFLAPDHPYAADLDLFGKGSLFELINASQTQAGRGTLAAWLLHRAEPDEITARQRAVDELRPKLDLREELALLAEELRAQIHTDKLKAWARQTSESVPTKVRLLAFCLPLLTLGLFFYALLGGSFVPLVLGVALQAGFALGYRRQVSQIMEAIHAPVDELKWLAGLLTRLEKESFQSPRLQKLQLSWTQSGVTASASIDRLARLVDWLESRNNILFAPICCFWLWGTQFAFAIGAWKAEFGPRISEWLLGLGEMEALSSLAGYAFEHPADVFPELISDSQAPLVEAEGLGHPLIPEGGCVRNDIRLSHESSLLVVSGSNMSGKSTWLRALGANLVLAMAGAPVRARKLRLSPLQIGASIRTMDSLQEGVSRFYAEITRLSQIIKLTEQPPPLLFLLDELLSGTNSHDRRLGAASIVRSLIHRGAIGMITTHDLALTHIVEEVRPHGANVHFEDQIANGRMSFDYQLRAGIVEKSNALELMRSVGLEI